MGRAGKRLYDQGARSRLRDGPLRLGNDDLRCFDGESLMPLPLLRRFEYRQISADLWGAFIGFECVATGPTEQAVRALVADRHR